MSFLQTKLLASVFGGAQLGTTYKIRSAQGCALLNISGLPPSAHATQEIYDQDNQQDCPEPHPGASAGTPATMAVVPSAPAKHQHQNDEQNQHVRSIVLPCDPRCDPCNLLLEHLFSSE